MSEQRGLPFGGKRSTAVLKRRTVLPAPWERIDTRAGTCGSVYRHPSGWVIEHCGHPTALWPYALYSPDGYMVRAPNGRAFQNLKAAAEGAQLRIDGKDTDR